MKPLLILLLVSFILQITPTGGQILSEIVILFVGTALPIQAIIYSVRTLRPLHPIRRALVGAFDSLPCWLGFSFLLLIGVGLITTGIVLVRHWITPSDSFIPITLGFLWGIMGPVFCRLDRGRRIRE